LREDKTGAPPRMEARPSLLGRWVEDLTGRYLLLETVYLGSEFL